MKVTNTTNGPKGIRTTSGDLVMLEAGQSVDLDLATGEEEGEWFAFKADEPEPQLASLSGKTKAELLEIAAAEGVTVPDDATNAQITDAITAKRSADAA